MDHKPYYLSRLCTQQNLEMYMALLMVMLLDNNILVHPTHHHLLGWN